MLIVVLFKSVYILSDFISQKNCPHKLCSSLTNKLIWIAYLYTLIYVSTTWKSPFPSSFFAIQIFLFQGLFIIISSMKQLRNNNPFP